MNISTNQKSFFMHEMYRLQIWHWSNLGWQICWPHSCWGNVRSYGNIPLIGSDNVLDKFEAWHCWWCSYLCQGSLLQWPCTSRRSSWSGLLWPLGVWGGGGFLLEWQGAVSGGGVWTSWPTYCLAPGWKKECCQVGSVFFMFKFSYFPFIDTLSL